MEDEPEFWQKLMARHGSAVAIAKNEQIGIRKVRARLERFGIPTSQMAAKNQLGQSIAQDLLERIYSELRSIRKTAKFFGISEEIVSARVPQAMRSTNRLFRHCVDDGFFNQDSEKSFYWAGFLMADGCLLMGDGKYKRVSVYLADRDVSTILSLKYDIQYSGPVQKRPQQNIVANGKQYTSSAQSGLQISSDGLFDGLARFGLTERKSQTAVLPAWLSKHPLFRHFVRGLFDGDGSISFHRNGASGQLQAAFSICGTDAVLDSIVNVLKKDGVVKNGDKSHVYTQKGIKRLEFCGTLNTLSFRDFLYQDATTWMDRKRERFFDKDLVPHPKKGSKMRTDVIAKVSKPIEAVSLSDGEVIIFLNQSAVERDGRFATSSVRAVIKGRQKQHRGYIFRRLPTGSLNYDLTPVPVSPTTNSSP